MAKKLTAEDFIKKAVLIHDDKYDYDKVVYKNNYTKVNIYCKICDEIRSQTPAYHLNSKGCKKCSFKNRNKKIIKRYAKTFTKRAEKIHSNKYNYSEVEYKGVHTPIKIICPEHGMWETCTPNKHLQGRGCPKCSNQKNSDATRKTTSQFIHEANKIHCGEYEYHKINYINSHTKIEIYCTQFKEYFWMTPSNHLKGQHYKKRSNGKSSKSEIEWLDKLKIPNDDEHRQVKLFPDCNYKEVDGYDPATNTVYEFLGDFFHGNPNIYNPYDTHPLKKSFYHVIYHETAIRINELEKLGYSVKFVWEEDYKKGNMFSDEL